MSQSSATPDLEVCEHLETLTFLDENEVHSFVGVVEGWGFECRIKTVRTPAVNWAPPVVKHHVSIYGEKTQWLVLGYIVDDIKSLRENRF